MDSISRIPDLVLRQPQFQHALSVFHKLRQAGYETWLAGGSVRDLLLGRMPADFDLATAATPDQVEALFGSSSTEFSTVSVGKQFGVIVVVGKDQVVKVEVEVATFRKDGGYQDGRRPQSVEFSSAREDARRRDFTVNALFMDPETLQILDFVGGREDLRARCLRAVGDPLARFSEDHLRILRAVRFHSQLGFSLEPELERAVEVSRSLLRTVSRERVREEWEKLLGGEFVESVLGMIDRMGLVPEVFWTTPDFLWSVSHWKSVWSTGWLAVASRRDQTHGHGSFASEAIELRWIGFFLSAWRSGTSEKGIRLALRDFKGSKQWEQSVLQGLFWFFQPQAFAQKRLGELLEQSFSSAAFYGLQLFVDETAAVKSEPRLVTKWNDFLRQRERWISLRSWPQGPSSTSLFATHVSPLAPNSSLASAPKSWFSAADFGGSFSGPQLGKVLREAYWLQLERGALQMPEFSRLKSEIVDEILRTAKA
jgi:tRNA nucleotidyltransferase/poly(A) polymerase